MQFVKTEDLKIGMRLARPIYSKKGVLLFDRNSNLTAPAIESVRNFELLGIYILEPAEPLPPMSDEDLEFERFIISSVFPIQDEINSILHEKKQGKIYTIADTLIRRFGHLEEKINFYQNLRSKEDYVYRHSLNVAILCAMMTHVLNLRREEQRQIVLAAIVHDIGKIQLGGDIVYRDDLNDEERTKLYNAQLQDSDVIEQTFHSGGVAIRRICVQAAKIQMREEDFPIKKALMGAKILTVANRYDELTAMTLGGESKSEVTAIQELLKDPEIYDPQVVNALIQSVNILFPGVSVEMNTGEKALVLVENPDDILRPMVLTFSNNSIVDLSLKVNEDFCIVDIMKTLDNRCIMNMEALKATGYNA